MVIRLAKKEDSKFFTEEITSDFDVMRKLNLVGAGDQYFNNDKWEASFILEVNKKAAGFVTIKFYSEYPRIYVSDIFIKKSYRRMGYAKKLVEHALQFAKNSWTAYYIYAFTIENTEAEKLFVKLGFKNCGIYKDFYCRNGKRYGQTFWKKEL